MAGGMLGLRTGCRAADSVPAAILGSGRGGCGRTIFLFLLHRQRPRGSG